MRAALGLRGGVTLFVRVITATVEGASGWLNHNMVMPEHNSSAMTYALGVGCCFVPSSRVDTQRHSPTVAVARPSMRRRVRMSVSDRGWQSSRGLTGKGDGHGHLATVPDTLPSPVKLAAAPEDAAATEGGTASGSVSSAPAERKGAHSALSHGSNRQRTTSSFSVEAHEMVPLEVHLSEVGNLVRGY